MAKIELKISKQKAIALLGMILLIAGLLYYSNYLSPIKVWDYHGQRLSFRANLRKAENIPVYPDDDTVYQTVVSTIVRNITIAYKDSGEYSYYATNGFEIAYKTKFYYMLLSEIGLISEFEIPEFNVVTVEDYSNVTGTPQNPVIVLIGPDYADETSVIADDYVVRISGETSNKLDLATVKFLMIVMNIDLDNPDNSIIR